MSVELRHLRYFVAVAEELSFSRAAERLRVAQPALSAQVATLERRLGCRLLTRTTRKVELTDQGRLLLERAREILGRVDETLLELAASVRGERGMVRVGFVAHGAGELGSEILRRFAAALPGVETELVESATLEAVQRNVRDRETDVAFSWLPLVFAELEAEPIGTEGLAVALSSDHALAAGDTVTIADLRGTPIVAPWENVPFELLRPWLGEARPDGRLPGDPNAVGLAESLGTVARGVAVYCVPDSVPRFYARPDLVFRDVADAAASQLVLVRRCDAHSPAIASFVEIAREVAAARAATPAIENDRV